MIADDTLAQIEAMVRGYKQRSFGPFTGYAGVYDNLKSCKRLPTPDALLGSVWLQAKWVTWFEGDDIVFIQFLVPDHLIRGRLKFKRDFELRKGSTIKLYDVTWASGATA